MSSIISMLGVIAGGLICVGFFLFLIYGDEILGWLRTRRQDNMAHVEKMAKLRIEEHLAKERAARAELAALENSAGIMPLGGTNIQRELDTETTKKPLDK